MHFNVLFEALECDEDDREVVEGADPGTGVQHLVGDQPTDRVDRRHLAPAEGLLTLLGGHVPNDLIYCIVLQLVENSVGRDQDVVKRVNTAFLVGSFGFAGHDALHPVQVEQLCLAVAKGATHREPAREHAVGTHKGVLLIFAVFGRWNHILSNLLRCCSRQTVFHDSLGLVDVSSVFVDTFELVRIGRLVVSGELFDQRRSLHLHDGVAAVVAVQLLECLALDHGAGRVLGDGANGAAVAHIDNVEVFVDD